MKRFDEDATPEDPAELAKYKEEKRKIKMGKERRDIARVEKTRHNMSDRIFLPAMVAVAKKGIPLESFEFKPSAEYPNVDDYLSNGFPIYILTYFFIFKNN